MRREMTVEETEEFIKRVDETYGSELVLEGSLHVKDEKRGAKKIFLYTGTHVPKVALEWMGQHFATIGEDKDITLSIEGAQAVGASAKKTFSICRDDAEALFAGKDVELKNKAEDGHYILKTDGIILCAAKVTDNRITNAVPQSRRTRRQYQR